jgi:flagellar basal-body rod protein FlgB
MGVKAYATRRVNPHRLKMPVRIADKLSMSEINGQFDVLARLLDVASLRQRTLAHNVANVNTPGFRRSDVRFEDAFARALASGNEAKALRVQPQVIEHGGDGERADGNNLDIDVEMGRLEKNTALYKVYSQLLASQLANMRAAISGHG